MRKMRVATVAGSVVAAVTMMTPAPASASGCTGKFAETCQEISNFICYVFGKCF